MSKAKTIKEGKKVDECPECGGHTAECWTSGPKPRMLRSECRGADDCFWRGEPYTPPKRAVQTTKWVETDQFGGFVFESFDQYGHSMYCSQTYSSHAACMKAAQAEVDKMSTVEGYGICSAVVWPAKVKVRGSLIKPTKKTKKA